MRPLLRVVAVAAAIVAMVLVLRGSGDEPAAPPRDDVPAAGEPARPEDVGRAGATPLRPGSGRGLDPARLPVPNGGPDEHDRLWDPRDWALFEAKIRWADSAGLADLPAGAAIGRLAESFVGTSYAPGTLEVEGPERLVIDFREFDCVTFVENVLALTRFIRSGGAGLLDDPTAAQAHYDRYLEALRYRGGVLDGYASRLHYFSEWLADNESRGLVRVVTGELDPAADAEPIDFMSTHPDAYRQLSEPGVLAAIEAMEARLNGAGPRSFVPQDRIGAVADRIETGDVIAATSTVPGLDIAHTGIALWIDGWLHLVHAPLVGRAVEISEVPLADRIASIRGQDGIMVARPVF